MNQKLREMADHLRGLGYKVKHIKRGSKRYVNIRPTSHGVPLTSETTLGCSPNRNSIREIVKLFYEGAYMTSFSPWDATFRLRR